MTDPSPPNLKEVLQELELRFGSCFDDSNRCYDSADVSEWCDCCLFEKFKGEAAVLVPAPQPETNNDVKWQRLNYLCAKLELKEHAFEAHDIIRELRAAAARSPTPAAQADVWIVESGEYEQRGVVCVGVSAEAAFASVRADHPSPYRVTWETPLRLTEDEWTLVGHFEQVTGYSTQHTAAYDASRYPLKSMPSPPVWDRLRQPRSPR